MQPLKDSRLLPCLMPPSIPAGNSPTRGCLSFWPLIPELIPGMSGLGLPLKGRGLFRGLPSLLPASLRGTLLPARLSEAKQQQSVARQGLTKLQKLLQEEQERRLAAEEACAAAQEQIRRCWRRGGGCCKDPV